MSEKHSVFKETMELLIRHAYKIRYVPHRTMDDYNATYNVICENKRISTSAAEKLSVPLNEIWISEMWKSYEQYVLFHELREIYYRAKGVNRNEAHEKAIKDGFVLWENDPLLQKLIKEVEEMDRNTAEKKKHTRKSK